MRTLTIALLLATAACSSRGTGLSSPRGSAATSPQISCSLALEPIYADARCLDVAEACLAEARTRRLYDPLDSFTREQEELLSSRACLVHLRNCRSRAFQ